MRGPLLALELVLRGTAQLALGDLLQAALGALRALGELGRHAGAKRAAHEVVCHVIAAVEVERPHDRLVHVLERGVEATGPRALLGLAEDDAVADAEVGRHLGEHLARDERDLEAGELALVHGAEALEQVGGDDGAEDGVTQELEPLVGGRDRQVLHGARVRDRGNHEVVPREVVVGDVLDVLDAFVLSELGHALPLPFVRWRTELCSHPL